MVATKNLELFFLSRPLADLATIKALDSTNIASGVSALVLTMGIFRFDKTSSAIADDLNVIEPTIGGGRWFRQTMPEFKIDSNGKIDASILPFANPLQFKGDIYTSADFPLPKIDPNGVRDGWFYIVRSLTVTDNDPTKTNTGQIFNLNEMPSWVDIKWELLNGIDLWTDNGTQVKLITARDIDLQSQKIINLANPIANNDAVNLSTLSNRVHYYINDIAALKALPASEIINGCLYAVLDRTDPTGIRRTLSYCYNENSDDIDDGIHSVTPTSTGTGRFQLQGDIQIKQFLVDRDTTLDSTFRNCTFTLDTVNNSITVDIMRLSQLAVGDYIQFTRTGDSSNDCSIRTPDSRIKGTDRISLEPFQSIKIIKAIDVNSNEYLAVLSEGQAYIWGRISASQILVTDGSNNITSSSTISHNSQTSGLQGGTSNQYYHLTSAKYTQYTAGTITASGLLGTNVSNQVATITALPNGTTATTQTQGDNSTKVATTAYVDSSIVNERPPEVLTITVDGQTAFTLAHTPILNTAVKLYLNGLFQKYGTDYTVSGTTLTWLNAGSQYLYTTDALIADYQY